MTDIQDALHRAGIALFQDGDVTGALEKLAAALALAETRADIAADLGVVQHAAGNLNEAEAYLTQACASDPGNVDYVFNLARVLSAQGRAAEAEKAYRQAIALDPSHPAAHNNLGNLMKDARRHGEAADCYATAIAADETFAPAHRNLADAREAAGDFDGAEAAYAAAIHLRRDAGTRIRDALLLPVIMGSADQIAASRARMEARLDELLDDDIHLTDPLAEVGATNFLAAYHGQDDRAIQEKIALIYKKACPQLLYRAPHVDQWMAGLEGGPMRIGFVSAFFHEHSIGRLNVHLIERLPRPEFEVHVFSFSKITDPMAARIGAGADHFHRLATDLDAARNAIAAAELDCLYFTDIGMEPLSYFLAFSRLAPIQCATWGHPVTTGIPAMDYFISSRRIEPADAEAGYSETLVRLDDFSHTIPNPCKGMDLGGRSNDQVLVCPQSLFKFHPDFDPILERIMAENPSARLDIIAGNRDNWTQLLRARLDQTVPAGEGRIRFVPRMGREDYLRFLSSADAVLDTPQFCGGVTSMEALAAGTPVVTLPGAHTRGRLTSGIYRQMGYRECIAENGDAYAALVTRLLNEPDFAQDARRQIREGAERIFSPGQSVRQHAKFFARAMFEHS
ncbi:MAG: tetratricopeptide repeat protein [Rhodospirillaceae bacterium]|nr:tetratricopeptide repeat protein [Rhodospirillaceae bacterium]